MGDEIPKDLGHLSIPRPPSNCCRLLPCLTTTLCRMEVSKGRPEGRQDCLVAHRRKLRTNQGFIGPWNGRFPAPVTRISVSWPTTEHNENALLPSMHKLQDLFSTSHLQQPSPMTFWTTYPKQPFQSTILPARMFFCILLLRQMRMNRASQRLQVAATCRLRENKLIPNKPRSQKTFNTE